MRHPTRVEVREQLLASLALPAADELHRRARAEIERLLAEVARLRDALRRQKQHNREVNRALSIRSAASEKWLKRALSAERNEADLRSLVEGLRVAVGAKGGSS